MKESTISSRAYRTDLTQSFESECWLKMIVSESTQVCFILSSSMSHCLSFDSEALLSPFSSLCRWRGTSKCLQAAERPELLPSSN